MHKKILDAGNVATTDTEAETMLITCTNALQQRFERVIRAIYESADRQEGKQHLHLAPRLDELSKSLIEKVRQQA